MERNVMADLVAWKTSPRRKPLLLLGARQVGKTWLLQELGKRHYRRTVYVSLDRSSVARSIFDADLTPDRILSGLAVLDGNGPIDAATTLIVLDEIQQAPRALASLKYFAEDAPEYHLACAGSLLGVASHQDVSFPVGKVNFIAVHPLSLTEFLGGIGETGLAELLRAGQADRFPPFHESLVSWTRAFLFIGGMPEVVDQYALKRDLRVAREVQQELLLTYDQDFSKHAPLNEVPRLRALFASIPQQLARENKRFVYGQAQRGARAKTMELALQWLLDAGLVHQIRRVQIPRLPLASYADQAAFKLYFVDVGLTSAAVDLDAKTLLNGSAIFTEFKGALTEQYVLQELITAGFQPFYWTHPKGAAEVDFIIQVDGAVVPIEVKAEVNIQAKSLRVFRDEHSPRTAVRLSLRPFRDEGWLVNLPLYAAGMTEQLFPDRSQS